MKNEKKERKGKKEKERERKIKKERERERKKERDMVLTFLIFPPSLFLTPFVKDWKIRKRFGLFLLGPIKSHYIVLSLLK